MPASQSGATESRPPIPRVVKVKNAYAEEVRKAAYDSGQFGAANTAIKGKGILSGKWVERAEIGAPGEYDALSDDELERQIMERVARLGYVLTLDIPHLDNAADVDNDG
jgi:hypothetical protein